MIKSTTLVIKGTDDRVIKSTSSETIAKNILNARLIKIDKGSRLANGEMSSVYNKEVLSFFRAGWHTLAIIVIEKVNHRLTGVRQVVQELSQMISYLASWWGIS